jgi:hypothetical protein
LNVAMGFMVFLKRRDARAARKNWIGARGAEQSGLTRRGDG